MRNRKTDSTETVRIELFLRTSAPAALVEPLRETVARARRLEERDMADDVRVTSWSAVRPALEELSDSGPSVSRTVDAFESWADREGYSLRPAFDRCETTSMLGRPAAQIQVPTVCIAVYEGDDLQCVAPCSDGDRTYTVEDCLAALEDGATEPFADGAKPLRDRLDDTIGNPTQAEKGE